MSPARMVIKSSDGMNMMAQGDEDKDAVGDFDGLTTGSYSDPGCHKAEVQGQAGIRDSYCTVTSERQVEAKIENNGMSVSADPRECRGNNR
jgi:hypothetical protein